MVNGGAGGRAIESRAIPARKKKPARNGAGQKQKREITLRSCHQEIRAVCRRRAARWVIACVVIPVDGGRLSFGLSADAVVCGQEVRLLIISRIIQERARA